MPSRNTNADADPTPVGVNCTLYEAYYQEDIPFRHRPWTYRYLWRIPVAYWTCQRGNEDGAIVYHDDHDPGLWARLKRWLASRLGLHVDLQGAIAHQYGHVNGYTRPPLLSVAYWLNIMGNGFRCRDPHNLLPRTQAWLHRHDETLYEES